MPTTVSEARLDAYIAKHPGGPCGTCGTSWKTCTDAVLRNLRACCGACGSVDTHGNIAAERELRRRGRQPRQVTVKTAQLEDLAKRLRQLDVPPHWREELAQIAGELRSLASNTDA
jgi:hypothetical protein